MDSDTIILGDALEALRGLSDASVECCVTSPPYFGLRDYGEAGQIGREATPGEYIDRLIAVFSEVFRVLKDSGTLWLNIADVYCNKNMRRPDESGTKHCKPKDLMGLPWALAFRLREEGWYLRNDIIWVKPNPVPENVSDRLSRCYEHIFLLAKSRRYHFDAKAVAEPVAPDTPRRMRAARLGTNKYAGGVPGQPQVQTINRPREKGSVPDELIPVYRNRRDVWHISTIPYKGAHFAAFPPVLAKTCILAGCPVGGVVLDPFFGSGTTGLAARQAGRHYIGIDINAEYCRLAKERIGGGCP
jgi:DNA modification methylase